MGNPNKALADALGVPHNPMEHSRTDISKVPFVKEVKKAPVRSLVDMVQEKCLRDPKGNVVFNPNGLVNSLDKSLVIISPEVCALVCRATEITLNYPPDGFPTMSVSAIIQGYVTADGVQHAAQDCRIGTAPMPVKGKRIISEL